MVICPKNLNFFCVSILHLMVSLGKTWSSLVTNIPPWLTLVHQIYCYITFEDLGFTLSMLVNTISPWLTLVHLICFSLILDDFGLVRQCLCFIMQIEYVSSHFLKTDDYGFIHNKKNLLFT